MSLISTTPGQVKLLPLFDPPDRASIRAAVQDEIRAASKGNKTTWLDIDAIEHLTDQPGHFVYRLVLSVPMQIAPDQAITFQTQRPKDKITAIVVKADDEGLIVECQKALPADAKLLSISFDPAFILRALGEFIEDLSENAGTVARLVAAKQIPDRPIVTAPSLPKLNEDQAAAVAEMQAAPLYLLWGPPGTGKTTTMGAAIAAWMREGKSVLVVSTSNAAVDVALRSILDRVKPEERKHLLRAGTSLDPEVGSLTLEGKLADRDVMLAGKLAQAQRRITRINEVIASKTLSADQLHAYFHEIGQCEVVVRQFNEMAAAESSKLLAEVRVTGCTLARMVLDKGFRTKRFDVVVLDESSMASLLYAFAAALLADSHLVYAGDPEQLPPIVQAESLEARRWLGRNIYVWFGPQLEKSRTCRKVKLLRTQYRMTNQIGGLVSRLTYDDQLQHGRNKQGALVEFVELPPEWQTTHYSVTEKSYFHLGAVPVIHALKDVICEHGELLLLSPFRPQRSLFSAIAYDLREEYPGCKIIASTIHRSQGSECRTVVVDLTAHDPAKPVSFFTDAECNKLINVAFSRAKDLLIIVGSRATLDHLATAYPFWKAMAGEIGHGMSLLPCSDLLDDFPIIPDLAQFPDTGRKDAPALYSHSPRCGPAQDGADRLLQVAAARKLLVTDEATTVAVKGDVIVRQSKGVPDLFMAGEHIGLRYDGGWLVVRSPNVARVVWRIAFSHLADESLNPIQAKRFFCTECHDGNLNLRSIKGEGLFLVCSNAQVHQCYHKKRLSEQDARILVQMHNLKCSKGHPMTARTSAGKLFIGCENYPRCEETASFSLIAM